MTSPTIEAIGLTKHYGNPRSGVVCALDGLDVDAPAGAVTALLGPNGAGKTTMVKAVATLLKPTAGELRVAGIDAIRQPEAVRRIIGLAGQSAAVEPALTGRENLVMIAKLFGHRPAAARAATERILVEIDLVDDADRPVKGYSGGMRRRLDLGASLVGAPRILLLDEPTTGLDPRTRISLWESIRSLVAGGTDVLLTTQYLEEADQLADHVVIIDHGRVIAKGTPSELKSLAGRDVIEVRTRDAEGIASAADVLSAVAGETPAIDRAARRLVVSVDDGTARVTDAVRLLAERHVTLDEVGVRRPTLDEVFLTLTGVSTSDRDEEVMA